MACKRRLLRQPFIHPLHGCEFLLLCNLSAKKSQTENKSHPIPAPAGPASCNVCLNQVEHFEQAVIVREYRLVFRNLPQLPVKILNGIGCVNQRSYRLLYIGLSLRFCPHSGHCKDLFFNIPGLLMFRFF